MHVGLSPVWEKSPLKSLLILWPSEACQRVLRLLAQGGSWVQSLWEVRFGRGQMLAKPQVEERARMWARTGRARGRRFPPPSTPFSRICLILHAQKQDLWKVFAQLTGSTRTRKMGGGHRTDGCSRVYEGRECGCVTGAKSWPSLSFAFSFACHQGRRQLRDVSGGSGFHPLRSVLLAVRPGPAEPVRPGRGGGRQEAAARGAGGGARGAYARN